MTAIRELLASVSKNTRSAGRETPPPDSFDPHNRPYAVAVGNNKFGLHLCPACGKPPTETGQNNIPRAFLFRDQLSAKEHMISGLCQACQDTTFGEGV